MEAGRSSRRRQDRPWWGRLTGAFACVGIGLAAVVFSFGEGWVRLSYDLPQLFQHRVPAEVVLVFLDDETKRTLGERVDEPLSLAAHARLLRRLAGDHPRLVLHNILFDQRSPGEVEESGLATALSKARPVVLVASTEQWVEEQYSFEKVSLPAAPLRAASGGVGVARLPLDPDLAVRRLEPGTQEWPSASWVAASILGAPVCRDARARWTERWLNHYGPMERWPSVKFEQAVAEDGLAAGYFRDKIVVIGASPGVGLAGAWRDQFGNPWSRFGGALFPSSALHAVSLLNLWRGDWLSRLGRAWEWMIVALVGAVAGGGLAGRRPLAAAGLGLAGVLAVAAAGCLSVWWGRVWWPWLVVAGVQFPIAMVWSVAFNALCDFRDKSVLASSLEVHFSPARVREILKHPGQLRPGARRQEVSLLFTDIQNFSKLTALLHPEDLVGVLNAYYDQAIGCVAQTEGTVMDLVGDAMFALWNAPAAQPDHRERACRTAFLLQTTLRDFDAGRQGLPLRTRMGLHTGTVWVGNIGSARRFDYAALGEAVNLASRLEGLNRRLETEILATREVQRAVTNPDQSRLIGHFQFQGIDQPVEVYELFAEVEKVSDPAAWRRAFDQALHRFQRKDLDRAQVGFEAVLCHRPGDGVARFYLEQIRAWRERPLPEDWLGVVTIDGK